MAKYFVISTDPLSLEHTKALKEKLTNKIGWWHWLPNFWLVKDPHGTLKVEILRDYVKGVNPSARCFVGEVNPVTWAALTRKDPSGNDMADWLHKNWD